MALAVAVAILLRGRGGLVLRPEAGDERPVDVRTVEEAQLGAVARLLVRGVVERGRVVLALAHNAGDAVEDQAGRDRRLRRCRDAR